MTPPRSRLLSALCGLLLLCAAAASAEPDYQRFSIPTTAPHNQNLEIVVRPPVGNDTKPQGIIVLFGGRNWPGGQSLDAYGFHELADRLNLLLLSPSFVDDEYWQPQAWSGQALMQALEKVSADYGMKNPPLYYYGYSAGGQCANLFYFWRPESVRAVAIHACGVWSAALSQARANEAKAAFLITCGRDDEGRFQASYTATQKLREAGCPVIFKNYADGHELRGLDLARSFLNDAASGNSVTAGVAEDFSGKCLLPEDISAKRIEIELRNIFMSNATAELWLRP